RRHEKATGAQAGPTTDSVLPKADQRAGPARQCGAGSPEPRQETPGGGAGRSLVFKREAGTADVRRGKVEKETGLRLKAVLGKTRGLGDKPPPSAPSLHTTQAFNRS